MVICTNFQWTTGSCTRRRSNFLTAYLVSQLADATNRTYSTHFIRPREGRLSLITIHDQHGFARDVSSMRKKNLISPPSSSLILAHNGSVSFPPSLLKLNHKDFLRLQQQLNDLVFSFTECMPALMCVMLRLLRPLHSQSHGNMFTGILQRGTAWVSSVSAVLYYTHLCLLLAPISKCKNIKKNSTFVEVSNFLTLFRRKPRYISKR